MNYSSEEVWKIVPDYPHYSVSNLGRIKVITGKRPQMLKISVNNCGYRRVTFWNNGLPKGLLVHRLILLAFVGPCPQGNQVAHYDGDKMNNNLSNLRYATPLENSQDGVRLGRLNRGEKNGRSKLTETDVKEIIRLLPLNTYTQAEIAKRFHITQPTVSDILRKRRWKYLFV